MGINNPGTSAVNERVTAPGSNSLCNGVDVFTAASGGGGNFYITESGDFYVTEDGLDNYVTES